MVNEEAADLSCLSNYLRVSLLGFSSFCSPMSMILFTQSGGCPFFMEVR